MTTELLEPFLLEPLLVERVWGRNDLTPWFTEPQERPIGEAWLTGPQCVAASGIHAGTTLAALEATHKDQLLGAASSLMEFPLLIKLLFPQEKLSVQVHPDDIHAAAMGGEVRAKTECWYVLDAEPDATVALGFRDGVTLEQAEAALGTAALEELMHYEPVEPGDMVFVDAGTVHAIGPGVTLLEVQQPSDTTYRLWDYGRPRELHIADGLRVTKLRTAAGKRRAIQIQNGEQTGVRLIAEKHFIVDSFEKERNTAPLVFDTDAQPEAIIALNGPIVVAANDVELVVLPGHAAVIPASCARYRIEGGGTFVRCRLPAKP